MLPQQSTQALHVARNYRQRHVSLEAHDPVIGTDIQAMLLKRIDGRLYCRMLPAQLNELFVRLSRAIQCTESAFLGQNNKTDDLFELFLIIFRMESLVHANAAN